MNALLDGLKALGVARLAAMAAVTFGMLGLFGLLALRGGSEPMALLYGDLDLRDAGQVTDQLTRQHIAFRVTGGGTHVQVPANLVAQARVGLAKEGLPAGGSVGYEIFDCPDGFAATEFQQQINQTRALEGELDRTIRAINGVRAVRVLLVLPRREPFARESQDAQASVLLTMAGATRLDREGIQAILNLIAAAVPGLRPKNIAVCDSRGDLLARADEPTGPTAEALTTEGARRATELRLSRAVEEMLEKSLGGGWMRAEAARELTMRVLFIGSLAGELGQAARLAIARGARLDQPDGIDPALARLRIDARVERVLCELLHDIGALVRALATERIGVPVVACGIGNDPAAAVRAIRAGAREFLPLPAEPELIAAILEAASGETHAMVVRDPAMAATVQRAEQVAGCEASVLITGESGTRKEMLVRHIHRRLRRAGGPFVALYCAAIADNLLGSESFGHEKGAFSGAVARRVGKFEAADGGTLLLDEISELDTRQQAKLLRARCRSGKSTGSAARWR
jgi:type III secretory pathway lipoprotein EscJ/ActR/RegA family two-component response regulator